MAIHVTQEHIDRGIPDDDQYCAIALAVVDAGAYISDANAHMLSSPEIEAFMRAFDLGLPVQPFSFTLPCPPTSPAPN